VPAKPGAAVPAKPGAPAAPGAKPGAPTKPPAGPLVTIVTRNQFYRDGFRNMIIIAAMEGLVILLMIATLMMYIANNQPQDRYFATTADGRIMQMIPLDKANMDTPALLSWVAASASDVMTFNYTDYQKRLQQSSRHFTKSGWESFAAAMQRSRILDSVQAANQMVSAQPQSAPILIQEGNINGKYRWLVTMPLVVNYRSMSSSAARTDVMQLSLVVERVPALENPNGVGFAQWIAQAK
jgi:intracellular multiplication protein IcmL